MNGLSDTPNLLFLMTDHQRADSLGMVQAGVEVTPQLNRLAARSCVFTRAYTTCPLCVPARTALATGVYPTASGVVLNDFAGNQPADARPVHQYLAEAGYDVGHVGVHHLRLRPELRERVPFSLWIDGRSHQQYLAERGLDATPAEGSDYFQTPVSELVDGEWQERAYSNTNVALWDGPAEAFQDLYWAQQAADFVREPHDRPFALFVYFWAPHPPLRLPEPYYSLFAPDRIDLPENVGKPARGEPPRRRGAMPAKLAEGISEEQWRRVWAAHLGLVRLADDGVGTLLGALSEAGMADDTFVVFSTDHGDHLGQHRLYQKMEMYEQAIRLPLLVRGPGVQPRQVEEVVSHLDLFPTLLELTNVGAPEQTDGQSLKGVLEGIESLPADRAVFLQYSGNAGLGPLRRAVVTQRWKYVYAPNDQPELFDLEADPLEMTNLAADAAYCDELERLHQLTKEWAADHADWVSFG